MLALPLLLFVLVSACAGMHGGGMIPGLRGFGRFKEHVAGPQTQTESP